MAIWWAYTNEYLEKIHKSKIELEKITDIETEIKKLRGIRQEQEEIKQRIKGLGYKMLKNSPEEMYYGLRSRVFKSLDFMKLIIETIHPFYPEVIEEWLISIEDVEKMEEVLDEEYEREHHNDIEETQTPSLKKEPR